MLLTRPARRSSPRLTVQSFCSEQHDDRERHACVVQLSEAGLRLERGLGGPRTRDLQLEIELPGVDEIVWARAEICFDEVRPLRVLAERRPMGLIRVSGLRVVAAAARHRRLLREYVRDTWNTIDDLAALPGAARSAYGF